MPNAPSGYDIHAPRAERRRASRDQARAHADSFHGYARTAPRYEPARDQTCETHHRRLPCKRCTPPTP